MRTWERMREIVKQRTVTQGDLAQICGYDERQFSRMITGNSVITDKDIEKFCSGLGITPNDVLDLTTTQP